MQQKVKVKQIKTFHSPTHGALTFPQVIEKITKFVHASPDYQYRIIIGTDSQEHNGKGVEFVTALVVHRVGGGGIYFWQGYNQTRPYTLKERIYEEALTSLEFANEFIYHLKGAPELLQLGLEIHVDVGKNGKTKEIISEVVAMITGNGYKVKTKPESFGASKVADRHT
ncbi:MAG: ribonuclease H-like YkuK family protein [Patescibacteria group bacterium]|nr:MAG: ribonuclease H-like YkuK family protein [Patescibacteria group bacterium]